MSRGRMLLVPALIMWLCLSAAAQNAKKNDAKKPLSLEAEVKQYVKQMKRGHPDDVRMHAAEMLGYIGDRSVLPDLAENARTYPMNVRAKIVEAMGRMGGPKALRALVTEISNRYLLQGWDWESRHQLGEAIARMDHKDRKHFDLIKNRFEKGCEYSEGKPEPAMHFAMAWYGVEANVESILNWVKTDKPAMQYMCAERLGILGNKKSDEAFCMILDYGKDIKLRRIIAIALGRRRAKLALESLMDAMYEDEGVPAEAAQALGMLGDKEAIEELQEHLDAKDPNVRLNVAFAMARLGDKRGLDYAKTQLASKDPERKAKAAATLLADGEADGLAKLKEAWNDLDPKQRYWFIFDNLAGETWALPFLEDLAANERYPGIKRYAEEKVGELKK